MIGTDENTELIDWEQTTDDGVPVYVLEYDSPVSEPTGRPGTLLGASSGGTVPAGEQYVELPDGEQIPETEAVFEAEGTTLRIRREKPSPLERLRRYLPW